MDTVRSGESGRGRVKRDTYIFCVLRHEKPIKWIGRNLIVGSVRTMCIRPTSIEATILSLFIKAFVSMIAFFYPFLKIYEVRISKHWYTYF